MVPTSIFGLSRGTYGSTVPRSGLVVKTFRLCDKGGGSLVNYDYRGRMEVVVFNRGARDDTNTDWIDITKKKRFLFFCSTFK